MSNTDPKPAAYAVTVAYDWPDNHADSEFVGMFRYWSEARKAHEDAVASAKEEYFDGMTPEEEWNDSVTPGYYYETNVNYSDGGFYVKTVPLYEKDNPWLKDFLPE